MSAVLRNSSIHAVFFGKNFKYNKSQLVFKGHKATFSLSTLRSVPGYLLLRWLNIFLSVSYGMKITYTYDPFVQYLILAPLMHYKLNISIGLYVSQSLIILSWPYK